MKLRERITLAEGIVGQEFRAVGFDAGLSNIGKFAKVIAHSIVRYCDACMTLPRQSPASPETTARVVLPDNRRDGPVTVALDIPENAIA